MPTFETPEDATDPLTKLMLTAVPENARGNKTLSHLAELIGVTNWAQRKWIVDQKLSGERAKQIADVSEGRVAVGDFNDFVYK